MILASICNATNKTMAILDNRFHERFCWLAAELNNNTEAYRRISASKNPDVGAAVLMKRDEVKARIQEIKEEISCRSALTLSRAQEIIRQQVEGILPTKVENTKDGVKETYDRIGALHLAADFAGWKKGTALEVTSGDGVKFKFTVGHRNDRDGQDDDGVLEMESEVITPRQLNDIDHAKDITPNETQSQ
jgi:hypothetical protein